MLHKHQQKEPKYCMYCVGEKKDENKKNVTRGPNPPHPTSTRKSNEVGYAGWNFFTD